MNILLVNPYDPRVRGVWGSYHPPMGLLYIASVLEADGHQVRVVDANTLGLPPERVVKRYLTSEVEVLGLSMTAYQHRAGLQIASLVRRLRPDVTTLAGGPMPSSIPHVWTRHVDYVVVGEGEDAALGILRAIREGRKPEGLPNVAFIGKSAAGCAKDALVPLTTDLDTLPYPAFHALIPRLSRYLLKTRTFKPYAAPLFTTRGCQYRCSFCDRSTAGRTIRPRDTRDVVDEVIWLRDTYGVHQIDIEDDNFGSSYERAVDFLQRKARAAPDVVVNCDGGLRADTVTRQFVNELKKAQCVKVGVGVESGALTVLKRNRKYVPLDHVSDIVQWCREDGIVVHAFFILGLPGDTPESMLDTIAFAKRLDPHFANFSIATPFPGTRMLEEIRKNGTLHVEPEEGLLHGYSAGVASFDYPGLTTTDVEVAFQRAFREFYFRPRKIVESFTSAKSVYDLYWRLAVGMGVSRNT